MAEADGLIHGERATKYGPVAETFEAIANVYRAIRTDDEEKGTFDARSVAKVLVAMKLVRNRTSPENPDHLRDAAGYLGLLDELEQYFASIDI